MFMSLVFCVDAMDKWRTNIGVCQYFVLARNQLDQSFRQRQNYIFLPTNCRCSSTLGSTGPVLVGSKIFCPFLAVPTKTGPVEIVWTTWKQPPSPRRGWKNDGHLTDCCIRFPIRSINKHSLKHNNQQEWQLLASFQLSDDWNEGRMKKIETWHIIGVDSTENDAEDNQYKV